MANLLAPNGLSVARNVLSGANTYQTSIYQIKAGYGTAIGIGDLVKWGTSGNQGFLVLATSSDANVVGVFGGVLPYYDQSLQGISHGLNGSYQTTANPVSGQNISCYVIDDPFVTFIAQVSGAAYSQTWQGNNINFLNASNGVPNISGRSTLALDGSSVATAATLPFRIIGPAGVAGGPQDPTQTNAWIEVRLNTASALNPTGV